MRGGRIQDPLLAGHHRPASETPLNGVSIAGRCWPNIESWLSSCDFSRGSGPVLLENPIFFVIFQGGSGPPVPPSGSAHGLVMSNHMSKYITRHN